MAQLTTLEWIEIIQTESITREIDLSILQTIYSFENQAAPSSEVGRILGYGSIRPAGTINLRIGEFANKIAEKYDINFSERKNQKYKFWDLFFTGKSIGKKFYWKLRPELVDALEETQLTGISQYPEEIPMNMKLEFREGIKKTISVNSYERNPKAREECIKHWKAICSVCEFNFEKKYGSLGKGFIHVHHLIPIHKIGEEYEINPIKDLRPVCPNCHSMLHKENPPLEIEELRQIILLNE